MKPSLRRMLLGVTVTFALLVLSGAGALVASTRYLHGIAENLGRAVDCLRAVEQLEAELLSHHHAAVVAMLLHDPAHARTRSQFETRLEKAMSQAEANVVSPSEARAMDDVSRELRTYMAVHERVEQPDFPRDQGLHMLKESFDGAFSALERMIVVNQEQAEAARRHARLDKGASLAAILASLVLITVLVLALRLERVLVYGPLQKLRRAIREFARGEFQSRAPVEGVRELREISSTFNDMAKDLQRRQADQLAFLGGVAHDLRNPLSALSLAYQRSLRTARPPAEWQDVIDLVGRQVAQLDRMVEDLLDATRIHAGKITLQLGLADLRSIGRECVDLFRPTADDHHLVLEETPDAVPVRCDAGRIAQALNNLISNAIKYTPGGGTITVRIGRVDDQAYVSVEDTGPGIPTEEHDKIFEPFHRIGTTATAAPGSGLGLSVTLRIVQAHGGRIDVDNVTGSGSRFTFRLPTEPVERSEFDAFSLAAGESGANITKE